MPKVNQSDYYKARSDRYSEFLYNMVGALDGYKEKRYSKRELTEYLLKRLEEFEGLEKSDPIEF